MEKKEKAISIGSSGYNDFSFLNEAIHHYIDSAHGVPDYLKTIIFLSFQVEQTLKEGLVKTNPAFIYKEINEDVFKQLKNIASRRSQEEPMERRPYSAEAKILIKRYFLLKPKLEKFKYYLDELFNLRNDIVHADLYYDIKINFTHTDKVIAEAFEFLKLNTKSQFKKTNWTKVDRINRLAGEKIEIILVKKIEAATLRFAKLTLKERVDLISSPLSLKGGWGNDEEEHPLALKCPACKEQATSLVIGPDNSWGGDEQRYSFIKCRVCKLSLKEIEYKEIVAKPTRYGLPLHWGQEVQSIVSALNSGKPQPPDDPSGHEFL